MHADTAFVFPIGKALLEYLYHEQSRTVEWQASKQTREIKRKWK